MTKPKTAWRVGLAAVAAIVIGAAGVAVAAPTLGEQHVDSFRLPDQNYLARELTRMQDAKAVVLISYAAGDAQIRADAPTYAALKARYAKQGVEFMMLASRLGESRAKVVPDAKANGIDMPILFDYQQLIGEQLNVTRTADVMVVDPRSWTLVYRGPVADGAEAAIAGLVAGQKVAFKGVAARGAVIPFPAREKGGYDKISYARDVAPIIQKKCASCHQPNAIGPMPLNSYEQVKGFSPMIREVIRGNRMPPYLADQTVGHFADDDRLTPEQIKTIVHWVEGGAQRGTGPDPLTKVKFGAPDWPLGKPDMIVEVPAIKIPATGVLDYTRPVVPNVMKEGRWMKATTFRITDRQVVHHILTSTIEGDFKVGDEAAESRWGASLGGYGPGRGSNISPAGTGTWMPPSGGIAFQNHYTPYGKATEEKTQMGIYLYPKGQEPKYVLRTFGIFDFTISIPAGEEYHPEVASVTFPKDAVLYGITPHAHTRGGSANVAIRYPDGREEMLIALPRYDFNWQYEYFLAEPKKVPAGSTIIARWTYDNSKRNPGNPDYKKLVNWGEQTSEEMLATYLHYRWVDETVAKQTPEYEKLLQGNMMLGVMDDSLDGKLQPAELRGQMGEGILKYLPLVDTNKDGAIDQKELDAAMKLLPRGRRGGGPPMPAKTTTSSTEAPATPAAGGK